MAGRTDRVKGRGNAARHDGRVRPDPIRSTLYGDVVSKRRQWSAGRRAGLIAKARGTSQGADYEVAPSRRSAPSLL